MHLSVSFNANGATSSTAGKAIAKLIAHLSSIAKVNTAAASLATIVFIAVTNPVMGNTSKKL